MKRRRKQGQGGSVEVPLGYALVEIERINRLSQVIRNLVAAGSMDAKSIEEAAAGLLQPMVCRG